MESRNVTLEIKGMFITTEKNDPLQYRSGSLGEFDFDSAIRLVVPAGIFAGRVDVADDVIFQVADVPLVVEGTAGC